MSDPLLLWGTRLGLVFFVLAVVAVLVGQRRNRRAMAQELDQLLQQRAPLILPRPDARALAALWHCKAILDRACHGGHLADLWEGVQAEYRDLFLQAAMQTPGHLAVGRVQEAGIDSASIYMERGAILHGPLRPAFVDSPLCVRTWVHEAGVVHLAEEDVPPSITRCGQPIGPGARIHRGLRLGATTDDPCAECDPFGLRTDPVRKDE